jgi:hypothetical protein
VGQLIATNAAWFNTKKLEKAAQEMALCQRRSRNARVLSRSCDGNSRLMSHGNFVHKDPQTRG